MSNLRYGLISLFHHIPLLLATSFLMFLPIIAGNPDLPAVHTAWFCMPLLLSPAWCLWGIVRGIRRRGERHGIACAVMSAAGLALFVLMMWAVVYIGGRY